MEIVVMLLLVGLVGAMILSPLVKRSGIALPAGAGAAGPHTEEALADLEFDHATGKLADEDYETLRSRIRAAEAAPVPPVRTVTDTVLESLEAEIRAARGHRRFCTGCGAVLPNAARFCPACGTPVDRP
jgi:hypothetical protein